MTNNDTTENRGHFIRKISEAIAEFMSETLYDPAPFSFFGGKPRVGLGREEMADDRFTLLLTAVETTGRPQDETYETETLTQDGRVVGVTKRAPWMYRLTYDLVGPSLDTSTGMAFAGRAHAALFDHPELPGRLMEKRNLAFLPSVTLKPAEASGKTSKSDANTGSVITICAEFLFATGSPVAVDQRVGTRVLRMSDSKQFNTTRENDV